MSLSEVNISRYRWDCQRVAIQKGPSWLVTLDGMATDGPLP